MVRGYQGADWAMAVYISFPRDKAHETLVAGISGGWRDAGPSLG